MKGLLDMRLNNNFLIHKTSAGEILVPVEEESKSFHGIIKLNETGSEIVHLLEDNDLTIPTSNDTGQSSLPAHKSAITCLTEKS